MPRVIEKPKNALVKFVRAINCLTTKTVTTIMYGYAFVEFSSISVSYDIFIHNDEIIKKVLLQPF